MRSAMQCLPIVLAGFVHLQASAPELELPIAAGVIANYDWFRFEGAGFHARPAP